MFMPDREKEKTLREDYKRKTEKRKNRTEDRETKEKEPSLIIPSSSSCTSSNRPSHQTILVLLT